MSSDKKELYKQIMISIEENIFDIDFVEMLLSEYRQAKLTESLFLSMKQNTENEKEYFFDSEALEGLTRELNASQS